MVEAFVEGIVEEVNETLGQEVATFTRVLSLVTKHCKDEEIALPKREKKASGASRTRGGKVAIAFVDLFAGGAVPTKEEFYNACLPNVKAHKNAVDYTVMFYSICVAVSQGMTLKDAIEKTKDMPMPKSTETEEAVEDDFQEEDVM